MDYSQKKAKSTRFRAFAGTLFVKLRELAERFGVRRENIPSCIALVACPIITFYLFDLYTHNPMETMNVKTQLLNIVFYELMGVLFFGIFKYVRIALMLQSGVFMIVGLINYYVLNFRATPIRPWDIYSWQTAASVANNYNYQLEKEALMVIISFLILLVVESRFHMHAPAGKNKRILLILLPIVLLGGYTGMVQNDRFVREFGLYDKFFTPTVMNKRDGNIVAFLMGMEYMDVEKPAGYSKTSAGQSLQDAGAGSEGLKEALANPKSVNRPNIIVIMDEAFSDLSVLGEMSTNQDAMPFIHSLQKGADNTITGYLNVSVLGGNTANTEFEFLTGNSMAFLPQGSVAYQQYMMNEAPTMASYLKDLGYDTVAMHPYNPDGWDRSRVYPMMGFDTFLSKDDFSGVKKLRNYISDETCFDKIIDLYEKKEEGTPLFVFNVTMQNHGGYDEQFDNFTPDIEVDNVPSKSLPAYLSLIKRTDNAFQNLVEYFANAEEDTMIVFFGDHQPSTYVSNPIIRSNGMNIEALTEEENLLKYKVPYVIWSNFDIREQKGQETSANYLMIDVLENCGLPLPAYQSSLKEFRENYPVVSAMQVCAQNGVLIPIDELGEELDGYRSLQYYLLFDYER